MPATILHADLDAFYASVEQLLDPSLRGKPIAVGGGVVLAASYEAKAFGVHGGMPGRRGARALPGAASSSAATSRSTSGSATPRSPCSTTSRRWSSASRSTRPSPTSPGRTHLFGPPAEIAQNDPPARADRARAADLGRRGAHQASRQDRLAGRQARRARRRRSRRRARVPARSAGRADVGRRPGHQGAAGRARRHDHRPAGGDARPRRSSGCSGRAAGEKLAALAWNRDPREIETHRRAQSAGAQSALGRKPARRSASSARRCAISPTASARGCAPSRGPAAPSRCASASPTCAPSPARSRSTRRSRPPPSSPRSPRSWCARRSPIIRHERTHLAARHLGLASRDAPSCSSSFRSASPTRRAAPAPGAALARCVADRAMDRPRPLRLGSDRLRLGGPRTAALRPRRLPRARQKEL